MCNQFLPEWERVPLQGGSRYLVGWWPKTEFTPIINCFSWMTHYAYFANTMKKQSTIILQDVYSLKSVGSDLQRPPVSNEAANWRRIWRWKSKGHKQLSCYNGSHLDSDNLDYTVITWWYSGHKIGEHHQVIVVFTFVQTGWADSRREKKNCWEAPWQDGKAGLVHIEEVLD